MTKGEKSAAGRNPVAILTSPDGGRGSNLGDRIQFAVTGVLNFEGAPVTEIVSVEKPAGPKDAEQAFRKLFSHVPVHISSCARC